MTGSPGRSDLVRLWSDLVRLWSDLVRLWSDSCRGKKSKKTTHTVLPVPITVCIVKHVRHTDITRRRQTDANPRHI